MTETALAPLVEWSVPVATTFGVIFLAEMGDKTQLVCMALAAKHRHWPVLLGSIAAFLALNTLAVVFGAGLAQWVPERVLAAVVAALFGFFGVMYLRAGSDEDDDGEIEERPGHGIFVTAFLMIFLAEMGDKTQLAVAGMASTLPLVPVWIGATLALSATSALGVVAGRKLLSRIPMRRLHQVSGVFFLLLAALALSRVF